MLDILRLSAAALALSLFAQPMAAEPFYVTDNFVPSGWMGDGEFGTEFVELSPAIGFGNNKPPNATMVTYRAGGPKGWAGIYWQNRDGNWGEFKGNDLSDFQCITFVAKGSSGGETVEFKAGGIEAIGREFRDSFEASTGRIRLGPDWSDFTIGLTEADLSNVIGGFAVIMSLQLNDVGMVIFVDNVTYEDDPEICNQP